MFMTRARERIRGKGARVVYAEGLEERALRAAVLVRDQDLLRPILIGSEVELQDRARSLGLDLTGIEMRDPRQDARTEGYAAAYLERRKHKGVTAEGALEKALLPHYFGALMVAAGDAEGMVSGLRSETKPFLPAFEVIGLEKGYTRGSSLFIMEWPDRVLFYADCSVNIEPDPATLAEIGRATALSARAFGFDPRVAFLSFSTRGSASHERVARVQEAVRLCRAAGADFPVDGEMQFDAAFLPAVAKKKAPDSPFAEAAANVFIFPSLDAGNIAYKLTERLAGATALGPILQGLSRPVNDVSRGCSVQDLADVGVITALQAGVG
jgi:phosphate acetyltransferase